MRLFPLLMLFVPLLTPVTAHAAKVRIEVQTPDGIHQRVYLTRPVNLLPDRSAAARAAPAIRRKVQCLLVKVFADGAELAFRAWEMETGRKLLAGARDEFGDLATDEKLGPGAYRRIASALGELTSVDGYVSRTGPASTVSTDQRWYGKGGK